MERTLLERVSATSALKQKAVDPPASNAVLRRLSKPAVRADDGLDVERLHRTRSATSAGAGRFGMHTEGLHEGSTHEVGSESEILGCKGKERKGGVKNTQPDHELPVKWLDQQVALDNSTSVF